MKKKPEKADYDYDFNKPYVSAGLLKLGTCNATSCIVCLNATICSTICTAGASI